jgi:hypothetical protein
MPHNLEWTFTITVLKFRIFFFLAAEKKLDLRKTNLLLVFLVAL